MTLTADRYADWKAPAEDGDLLVWPDVSALARDAHANHRLLNEANAVQIQNVPLPVLRHQQRTLLDQTDEQLLIASGHQTELYHPGVWIKDVVASTFAHKLGGRALHVAVDTDQPKHLNLRWPGTTLPLSDDPGLITAEWSGLIAPPGNGHLKTIRDALPALSETWHFESLLPTFLDAVNEVPGDSLSVRLTAAQNRLDRSLEVDYEFTLISTVAAEHTPYLAFVHHILANAERFAADYNFSLSSYRDETGITSNSRPMPDLQVRPATIEMPFWLDDLRRGTRRRAEVSRSAGDWTLQVDGDAFVLDPNADGLDAADRLRAWLGHHHHRLAPRALTLTTFLRLLLVDQFVHGIGGGRYDQVTDRLIARHFNLEPPRFTVATATLLFPGAVGRTRVCLPCLAQEGHQLRHGLLGDRKFAVLAEMGSLPRRSLSRSMAFHNMHAALAAAAIDSDVLRSWVARYAQAQETDRQDGVIFDRELSYSLQTEARLRGLIDRVRML